MKRWPHVLLAMALSACSPGGGQAAFVGPDALSFPFTGTKRVLFVVAELDDAPSPFPSTPAGESEVRELRRILVEAYRKNSRGALSLEVDFTWPPVRVPKSLSSYPELTGLVRIRADALSAARSAGWDAEEYDREVIFAPDVWTGSGRGVGRTAWMPHKLPGVLIHEVGHTLGWGHASFWDGDPVLAGVQGAGVTIEYGDIYDPMGLSQPWTHVRYSGPWFAQRAAWLDDSLVRTVSLSGTYTVRSFEKPLSGPAALRIRRDAADDYWIFQRQSEPHVAEGVVIVRTPAGPIAGSLLLDMKPGSVGLDVRDAALAPGRTFDDSAQTGIMVRNLATVPGAVTLSITVDEARQAALDDLPIIAVLAPPAYEGPVSGTVDFRVAASDPDVGTANGAGIARIDLAIHDPAEDPPPVLATLSPSGPPYVWSYDTAVLPDASYFLAVTAVGSDGGERTVSFRFLVDNGSLDPAPPAGAISPDGGATAMGWVFDARGLPAPGVRVLVTDGPAAASADCATTPEPRRWSCRTDAAGCYALEDLPAGRPLLWSFLGPGGASCSGEPGPLTRGITARPDVFLAPSAPEEAGGR